MQFERLITTTQLRSAMDDLILYEPFHHPPRSSGQTSSFTTDLLFRKVPSMHVPKYDEDAATFKPTPLQTLPNLDGHASVFMAGGSPCFIFKEAASLPRIISLRGKAVKGLTSFNTRECEAGFAYVDATVCRLKSFIQS